MTEIGPYCFSASRSRSSTAGHGQEPSFVTSFRLDGPCDNLSLRPDGSYDDHFDHLEEKSLTEPTLPPLKGRRLEEILLPSSVALLHNAAFYNCRGLRTLGIGHRLAAIGSDVFTNCTALSHLLYDAGGEDDFALSLILGRLEMDLHVSLLHGRELFAALFFPEYYEWLDEVTPAHLFSRSIHGEGFRMRKCFQGRQLSYAKYDACFENAIKTESGQTLCQIALLRLLRPRSLSPQAKDLYKDTLTNHFETALKIILASRKDTRFRNPVHTTEDAGHIDSAYTPDPDLQKLQLLLDITDNPGASQTALSACIDADWSEGAAFIMDRRRHHNFARKKYDFK